MTCRTEYENRLQARQQSHDQLCQSDDRAVDFRMVAFGIGLVCTWAVLGGWQLPWAVLLLPFGLFIATVMHHESVQRKKHTAERAIGYYGRCIQRLDGEWFETGPTGLKFFDSCHPYAGDLDIFGPGSLYHLLGSPVTPSGARTLAAWLAPNHESQLPTREVVIARQNAVRSLRDQLDLREQLAVIGTSSLPEGYATEIHQWLAHSGGLKAAWIRLVATLLGVFGVAALGFCFATGHMSALIVIVLVQLLFVHRLRKPLGSIKQHSENAVEELRRIEKVVAALEKVEGEDSELRRLRNDLLQDGERASETIHRLERLFSQFENLRRNLFFAPLAFVSMVSVGFACAIDRWRVKNGTHVDRWFQAVGELEVLLAFTQLHFENPAYCFPQFIAPTHDDHRTLFTATQLSHPLLPPRTAVANDVQLSDDCRMLLISGSNMSGKSTLLRSVGINTALAWAGAPVFAQSLTLSNLRVAAAMRVQDSLQTGTSHFFAELQRIRLVVELAQQNTTPCTPVLFLLDEILHGTNSHDRLVGARGVIQSLLQAGAIGLVTTHDLALSDMVTELDRAARNVHFRDEWIDGKMTFNYHMHDGVVPKSNALSLMRLLGLDV